LLVLQARVDPHYLGVAQIGFGAMGELRAFVFALCERGLISKVRDDWWRGCRAVTAG